MIKIEQGYWGGYNIIEQGKTPSGKKYKQLIASGFSSIQKAIDYARLSHYNTNLAPDYQFTEAQKTALQELNAEAANNYWSWLGFTEAVLAESGGLAGLLEKIDCGLPAKDILCDYI